jgi:hypothetical protein
VIASTAATPIPVVFKIRRRDPCSSTKTGAESEFACLPMTGSLRHEIPGPFAIRQSLNGLRWLFGDSRFGTLGRGTPGEWTLPEKSVSDEFGGGGVGSAMLNHLVSDSATAEPPRRILPHGHDCPLHVPKGQRREYVEQPRDHSPTCSGTTCRA